MLGRDSRTLSKLFEGIVESPVQYEQMVIKAKEIQSIPQRKFILGLRY